MESTGKPVALRMLARQNTRASLKPTNLQEKRLEGTLHKDHKDHIAGKGIHSLNHYNFVHKFIPLPKAMKIPEAKTAVDKEWETLGKILARQQTKVRNKIEVIDEAR